MFRKFNFAWLHVLVCTWSPKYLKYMFCALPWVCKNCFSVVIRAIDNTLLLMFLQYTRNNCLSNNTDATIIHHSCPKCVKPFSVDICICLQQSNIIIFVLMGWTWKGLDKFDKGKEEKQSPLDQIITLNGTNFKSTHAGIEDLYLRSPQVTERSSMSSWVAP